MLGGIGSKNRSSRDDLNFTRVNAAMSQCAVLALLLLFSTVTMALPSEISDKNKLKASECTAQYTQTDQGLSIKDYGFTALTDAGDLDADHCFVRVDEVFKDWKNHRITLVDVRNKKAYASHRIPGAVNIPLFAVKQKGFLRQRNVVLMNEGRTHVDLLRACKELMANGFDSVKVLDGGIHSWITMNGAVEGNKTALVHHRVISSPEFVSALPERQWVVILLDGIKKANFVSLADNKVIEYAGTMDQLVNILGNAFEKHGSKRHAVLLANQQGGNYQGITTLLKEHAVANVFLLDGGINEYQKYLSQHLAMRARLVRGPEPVRRCGG